MKKLLLLITILFFQFGIIYSQDNEPNEDEWQKYKELVYKYDDTDMTAMVDGQFHFDWHNPYTWIDNCVVPEHVEHGGKTYTVNSIGPDAFQYIKAVRTSLPSTITKVDCTAFAKDYNDSKAEWNYNTLICKAYSVPSVQKWFSASLFGDFYWYSYFPGYFYQGEYMSPPCGKEIRQSWANGQVDWSNIDLFTYVLYEGDVEAISNYTGENRLGGPKYPGFSNCQLIRNIERIEFDDEVKDILRAAFWRCRNLQSIEFPEELDSIGFAAFMECTSLQDIKWPKRVKHIGSAAFEGCSNLTSVAIPSDMTTIPYACFARTGIKQFPLHEGIDTIMDYAFDWCDKAERIELPTTLKYVGEGAFANCRGIKNTTLTIPDNLKHIETIAFRNCFPEVTEIALPAHMDVFGGRAFWGMEKLRKVVIPQSIKSFWGPQYDNTVFYDSYDISEIYCYSPTCPEYDITDVLCLWKFKDAAFHIAKGSLSSYMEQYGKYVEQGNIHFVESLDSGVEELETDAFDASLPVEMISLTGVSMGTFPDLQTAEALVAPGIYICRQGSNVQKIAIK